MWIAGQYTAKFDQTLAKAAPNLFTFVLYDMDHANDHSGRTKHFVMGNRNVHMQICNLRGLAVQRTVDVHQGVAAVRHSNMPRAAATHS